MNPEATNNWRNAILDLTSTVKDAIRVINDTGLKIAMIIDDELKFVGIVSDGDIRRGLLKGIEMDGSVSRILQKNCITVLANMDRGSVIALMNSNSIFQIPILDNNNEVVGLHVWSDSFHAIKRNEIVVIMAGGRGTRLLPFTEDLPKPLLPVSGKPILTHIIEKAKNEGFRRFVISIHHLGELIEDYYGNGEGLDVEISYLREREPLGTAGALSLLNPSPLSPILVTNADVYSQIRFDNLLDFHKQKNGIATMATKFYQTENPFGVVDTDGFKIVGYQEKPTTNQLVNAGVYVLEPAALKHLKYETKIDMPELFRVLRENGEDTFVYPVHESWLDIGHIDEYLALKDMGNEQNRESNGNH
jgi:dTDP-glucose pyrophosphorylase